MPKNQVGPGFNFTSYLDALLPRKLRADEKVVMYALPYFKSLTKLLDQTDKRSELTKSKIYLSNLTLIL